MCESTVSLIIAYEISKVLNAPGFPYTFMVPNLSWFDTPQVVKLEGLLLKEEQELSLQLHFCLSLLRFICPAVNTGQSGGGDTQGLDRLNTSEFPFGRVLWGMNIQDNFNTKRCINF